MLRHSNCSGTTAAGSGSADASNCNANALRTADWLPFAAAPTFAVMAVLTGLLDGPPDMLCAAAGDASGLTGMVPMYALMSAFHSAPWLRLISSWRRSAHRA
ncbi:hypothetical protein [Sinorhizobium americanum]|uniref:Uncharacterized protein n=1 Tax=Sinorhizobium americanum TaxID=194963 RepID=A0A4V2RDW2_9HYPH|nr:hypothetical protein [Sinorhizobium americanum]TCN26380.1 hypothetical protein EV184_11729 [Sinorhizobium americanum]